MFKLHVLTLEPIDWDRIHQQLISDKKMCDNSSILLAVVKKNVPVDIVRLLLPSTKLKTLRNAFKCACFNKEISPVILEEILNEMDPTVAMAEALLLIAIKSNCVDAINAIIERHVNFLSPGFYYNTFHEDETFERLSELLIQRQLVHKDLIFNSKVLHGAAYRGHEILTNMIVNKYPGTLAKRDADHNLPLHCACESGEFEVARIILRKGMESNQFKNGLVGGLLVKNKNMKTALRLAIGSGADSTKISAVIEWLMDVDSKILCDERVIKSVDLLHQIVRHGNCRDVLQMMMTENPFCIQWKDKFGRTPLTMACEHGHFDTATQIYHVMKEQNGKFLPNVISEAIANAMDGGMDPDRIVDFIFEANIELVWLEDKFLLHRVAGMGTVPYAEKLLDFCPTYISSKDSTDSYPIHWACREYNCEMITYLLHLSNYKYGGLLSSDNKDATPLESLLVAYIDPDSSNLDTVSQCIAACLQAIPDLPLMHFAISRLNLEVDILQEIVEHFDLNATCTWRDGKTALIYVIDAISKDPESADSAELFSMFVCQETTNKFRHCISMKDHKGRLPLHYALSLGLRWENIIKDLIGANCSLSAFDVSSGLLPFMISAVGPGSDLNTTFHLLRSNPTLH